MHIDGLVQDCSNYIANTLELLQTCIIILQWCHNDSDGISNHKSHNYLLKRLFQGQIKENIKALHHWPLWVEPHTKDQ